jgi:hypothetical protein
LEGSDGIRTDVLGMALLVSAERNRVWRAERVISPAGGSAPGSATPWWRNSKPGPVLSRPLCLRYRELAARFSNVSGHRAHNQVLARVFLRLAIHEDPRDK